jgi:hypothetical protein
MKLSGYTTTRNCVTMDYPFQESIQSLIDFCDEVVVMDSSDGTDTTRQILGEMQKANKGKLFIYHAEMDWNAPNHGVYDGVLKQAAREKCTGDYLWQMDCDEVVHASDRPILENLIAQAKNLDEIPLLCLPVVEYWGGPDKVRVDINPWKWRVSRNHPQIVHGIPLSHRQVVDGLVYAKPGTDTCDYINKDQGLPVPNLNFMNSQIDSLRQAALTDPKALEAYEKWFNQMSFALPTVYHYSWYSIKGKIEKYKNFFGDFWKSMYNDKTRSSNVFFNVPWEQVTDEMIIAKATELRDKTGGWIFHKPWDGSSIPSVKILREPPDVMKAWSEKHPL